MGYADYEDNVECYTERDYWESKYDESLGDCDRCEYAYECLIKEG